MTCTNCHHRDHSGHVKPKSRASGSALKNFAANRPRSTASLDLGKSGTLLFPRDSASPLPFTSHGHGGQLVHSPDGHLHHGNGSGSGSHHGGASPLFIQSLSSATNPNSADSPLSSSVGSQHSYLQQTNLCFDYASSSDYDSDHYQQTSSYSYFPESYSNYPESVSSYSESLASYPVSNASDDMDEMMELLSPSDSRKIMDGIMNGTTALNPMESSSADEIRMLYSALSSFSTSNSSSPSVPSPPARSYSSPAPASTGSIGAVTRQEAAPSPMGSNTASEPPSAGRSEYGDEELPAGIEGCGCAISASMCCCG